MSFRSKLSNSFASAAAAAHGQRAVSAVISAASGFAAELFNRYEAAMPSSPARSYIPALVRDSRYDANSWSRWEMLRKIRYFERNVWLVQALGNEHFKWSMGPNGLPVVPASSDDEWNKAMQESYLEWCEQPCYDSTLAMPLVQKQIAKSKHFENDLFILKTFTKQKGLPSRPAIQLIESHRCSAPGQEYTSKESEDMIDGVQLSITPDGRRGAPIGYWILDNDEGSEWVFRSVNDVIHLYEATRPGELRGITQYHSVENTLNDLDDMELLEMGRAKANAEVSNIITNAAGEISQDDKRLQRYGFFGNNPTPPINVKEDAIDSRIQVYRKVLGAKTIALKTGETMTQFDSKSPSASTQWYWRYKIGQVCVVAGVPMILLFPELIEGAQGTVVRGILDNAHQTFRSQFHQYANVATQIYRFYANWARYNDKRCVDAPADWNKCHVIPPRACNVDIGRNSAAMLAELAAGTTNYDDVAGANGTTAEVLLRKKANNIVMIKKLAAELTAANTADGITVEPGEIAGELAAIAQTLQAAQEPVGEPEDEDDDEAPKKKKGKKEPATK